MHEEESQGELRDAPTHRLGVLVAKGISWSALSAFLLRIGQLGIGIVIARIVSPEQFGIFAVALIVYAIVSNVSDLGLASAVVREVGRTKEIAPTVSTLALGSGTVLTALMVVLAPSLAEAFGSIEATGAIQLLALTILVGSFGAVPAAVLARDYRQRERFLSDAASFVAANGILVLLALEGWGVMALVASRIVGQLISTLLLIVLTPERYFFGYDKHEVGRLLRFSLPLAGSSLIGFTVGNIDSMAVGRLEGSTKLAYYNQAYNVSGWPVSLFTAILNGVTLTTLSRVRESNEDLRAHMSAALSALAAASLPLSALCAGLSRPMIGLLYGPAWLPTAGPLAVLAIFGSIRVAIALFSDLLVALGHTRRFLVLQALWLAALVPLMIGGVSLGGVLGAAWAHVLVAGLIVLPAFVHAAGRPIGLGVREVLTAIAWPLLGAVACYAGASFVAGLFETPIISCIAGGLAGGLGYLACTASWLRRFIPTLRHLYGNRAVAAEVAEGSGLPA